MRAEEYEQAVAQTAYPAMLLTYQLFEAVKPGPVTDQVWTTLLQALFETVREQAWQAAKIARDFYDARREETFPGIPMQPVKLASLSFENFVREMEPVRKIVEKPDFSTEVVALRVARSVENGARRTIIRAVENPDPILDPVIISREERVPEFRLESAVHQPIQARPTPVPVESPTPKPQADKRDVPRLVRGWARVPTGRETCGFCWMLASRGPVYESSWSGGGRITDAGVIRKTADGTMTSDDMNQWHTGCDCKIVPVFRLDDWPGKDKYEAAKKLWDEEIKQRYTGKDALNAFRKLVDDGEIQKILAASKAA